MNSPGTSEPLAEALAWFTRLQNHPTDAATRAEFARWLKAKPEHAAAYARVEQLWQSPTLAAALQRFPSPASRPVRRPFRRWALAASLVLGLWGGWASGWVELWRADYRTLAGEQRRLVLADGSTVTLNTDSALSLEFAANRRGVRLLAGEAFFEVRPDPARPFVIEAGPARVTVVGTRFAVRAGTRTLVTVTQGVVNCANSQNAAVRLVAGQQLAIAADHIAAPEAIDAERATAWLKGRLIFQDRPLREVVDELDRYHPGLIALTDDRLGAVHVTGNYKLDDTAAVLRALADIAGARVTSLPYLTLLR